MKKAFNEVKLLLRGFDVVIKPSEEDECYQVIVYENTKQVAQYDVHVDFDQFEGTDEDLDGSDDIYEYVGNAAIDLYESSRNTLGQGAGAMNQKTSIRKSACYLSALDREDWFLSLKGTPYEQQALELLTSYIDSIYKKKDQSDVSRQITEVADKEREAFYQLEKICIEYIKELDPHQTVIIVQAARKISFYGMGEVQELLDLFEGTKWESQVIDLIRTILDCRTQLDNLYNEENASWKERSQLNAAMDELSLVALEDKLDGKAVINQMPEMLEDLVELAAGVDFSEPIEPMGGSLLSTKARKKYSNYEYNLESKGSLATLNDYNDVLVEVKRRIKIPGGDVVDIKVIDPKWDGYITEWTEPEANITYVNSREARKRAYEDKEPEEKENVGLSMAVCSEEEAENKFMVNQEVSLNKKIEVPLWNGVEELASGTKGVIETVYDDMGNDYLFRSEEGITVRVNKDDLKKR